MGLLMGGVGTRSSSNMVNYVAVTWGGQGRAQGLGRVPEADAMGLHLSSSARQACMDKELCVCCDIASCKARTAGVVLRKRLFCEDFASLRSVQSRTPE